jgi:proteasome accessory factor A
LAAAVAFFGAGYLLPLPNGRIVFSLSGRAHHLGKLISLETTIPFQRGLLNSRREPHVAGAERLHLIAFDYVLASAALRCSFLQCVVAAAEEGYSGLGLYDPLGAVRTWSWNLDLKTGKLPATALLLDGRKLTLPEYIRTWTTELHSMVEQKLIPDAVAPDAAELLPRIIELTHHAEAGDLARCARHLDWAAKLLMILRTCRDGNAGLGDARARLTDQDYGNTDSRRGWFWRLWQEGAVDPLVSDGDAQAFMIDGPPETRAWARGRLVQRFCQAISDMDWSYVELRRSNSWWASLRIELPEITSLNCAAADRLFVAAKDVSELERLLYAQPDRRHDQSAYATSAGDEHPDNGSAP